MDKSEARTLEIGDKVIFADSQGEIGGEVTCVRHWGIDFLWDDGDHSYLSVDHMNGIRRMAG